MNRQEWASAESAENTFRDTVQDIHDDVWPNAVCLLDQCLIIRKAFKTETILFTQNVLLHFFVFLLRTIDTFPRYQVDLTRYFDEYYGDALDDGG